MRFEIRDPQLSGKTHELVVIYYEDSHRREADVYDLSDAELDALEHVIVERPIIPLEPKGVQCRCPKGLPGSRHP